LLAGAHILGAFEHHVLEQVGKTGAAFTFVARADVVGDINGDHWCAVVFDGNHAQAVRESGFFPIHVRTTRLRESDTRTRASENQTEG
jgi:hypothetical protein